MRHTISAAPVVPTFTPVVVTITLENALDLTLLTNVLGGVPAESSNDSVNALANDLRAQCTTAGIDKAARKISPIFNWGKKLRELTPASADAE